ncbi:isochorismatase family protein [Pseudonocardia sp. D17]|uniref:isochorismatase family protein n=1 Tax=Pseudonocardia sp. D17 TaxID=882661 RepID=UPI002B3D75A7|nr:N-carbamoylsarcosine amidase [Pseudonocardia sp. D17]
MSAPTAPADVVAKWEAHFPREELETLALAGYGNRLGFGTRPALLVVDATYSFCGAEPLPIRDAIAVNRRSCGDRAWAALEYIRELLAAARAAGIPVVYSAMRDPVDPAYEPGLWGAKNTRGVEDGGSPGEGRDNEILDEIAPGPGEIVFAKDKPSLFVGTGLPGYLVARGVDSLIICGGTSSGCVYATAVDGFSHNYRVAVAREASFDRVDTPHWAALLDIDMKYGDVVGTAEVVAHLAALRTRA